LTPRLWFVARLFLPRVNRVGFTPQPTRLRRVRTNTRATAARSLVLGLVLGFAPLTAHAQLEAAEAHFANARFEEALDALDALDVRSLDRADAIVELELRARVLHALGNDAAALDRALVRLIALSPEHRFPEEVPPDLVQALDRARGAPAADASVTAPGLTPIATTDASTAPWHRQAGEVEDEAGPPWPWIILGAGLVAVAIVTVVLIFALQPSRDSNEIEDPWELPPEWEGEL
jgi:hypothetical protein